MFKKYISYVISVSDFEKLVTDYYNVPYEVEGREDIVIFLDIQPMWQMEKEALANWKAGVDDVTPDLLLLDLLLSGQLDGPGVYVLRRYSGDPE